MKAIHIINLSFAGFIALLLLGFAPPANSTGTDQPPSIESGPTAAKTDRPAR